MKKAKKQNFLLFLEDISPILYCFNQLLLLLLFGRCHMCNIKIPAGTDMTSLGFFFKDNLSKK